MFLFAYVGTVGKPNIETNLYGYSFQDPVNFIDPSGLWAENWIADRYSPTAQAAIGGVLSTVGAGFIYAGYTATPISPFLIGIGVGLGYEGSKNLIKARERGIDPIKDLVPELGRNENAFALRCGG